MDLLRTFARPVLATTFVVEGVDAVTRPAGHVRRFQRVYSPWERLGLPPLLNADVRMMTRAAGVVSVAAGLGLASGRAPRSCALALAALNVPLTLVNHPLWLSRDQEEWREAVLGWVRRATLGAGLLLAAVDREGGLLGAQAAGPTPDGPKLAGGAQPR